MELMHWDTAGVRYRRAVETGDLETAAEIVRQAERDPFIELVIMVINENLHAEMVARGELESWEPDAVACAKTILRNAFWRSEQVACPACQRHNLVYDTDSHLRCNRCNQRWRPRRWTPPGLRPGYRNN